MKESMDQEISWYEDAWRRGQVRGRGRGQGNFKLAANFGYNSRGSAAVSYTHLDVYKRQVYRFSLCGKNASLGDFTVFRVSRDTFASGVHAL